MRFFKKWKTILALVLIIPASYYKLLNFYFALIYLIWSIQGIKYGVASFMEDIPRDENPFLFWTVSIFWMALAVWSLWFSEPVMNWIYRGF